MCEKCDRTVELLGQTLGNNSVVAFSFPGGEPKLVTHTHTECGDPDCYQPEHGGEDDVCRDPKCYFPEKFYGPGYDPAFGYDPDNDR